MKRTETKHPAITFVKEHQGIPVGRATLYIIANILHEQPYGYLEDLHVDEVYRGQGIGTELLEQIIEEARKQHCYKLIATSRYERERVHALYKSHGFNDRGLTFRLDLPSATVK